jgi:hypothetical protein
MWQIGPNWALVVVKGLSKIPGISGRSSRINPRRANGK